MTSTADKWAALSPHEKAWSSLGGGCLDHNTRGVTGCGECEHMATEYLAGWRAPGRHNEGDPHAAVVLSAFDDWDLTRTCEQILAAHLGPAIDVRPSRHREDAA